MAKRKLYVSLLRAEIVDTIDGLRELSVTLERRLNGGEITNYVFNENDALLKNEISGLQKLLPQIDSFDAAAYPDVNTLAQTLGNMLQSKIETLDDPRAVQEIIRRKQKKIMKYLNEQAD